MTWWAAALWGLLGAGLVETFDLYTEVRRRHALPWRRRGSRQRDRKRPAPGVYILASTLRLIMGCGVAAAAGASSIVAVPLVGVAIGVAAPLIIERLAKQVPLTLPGPGASGLPSEPWDGRLAGPGSDDRSRDATRGRRTESPPTLGEQPGADRGQ